MASLLIWLGDVFFDSKDHNRSEAIGKERLFAECHKHTSTIVIDRFGVAMEKREKCPENNDTKNNAKWRNGRLVSPP